MRNDLPALDQRLPETRFADIGGTRYAFELCWKVLSGLKGETPASEARQLAINLKRPFGVIVPTPNRKLVGLASGKPNKALSAAAIVGSTATRRLIVLDITPELIWVCLVSENGFSPEHDRVLDPARASKLVQEVMTDAAAKSKDTPIYTTHSLTLETPWLTDAHRVAPEALLESTNPAAHRLSKLDTMSVRARTYIALAILVPSFIGYQQYSGYIERKEQARMELEASALSRQQELDLATATALREAAMAQKVVDALIAETATPPTIESFAACLVKMRTLGRTLGGWRINTMRCEPLAGQITASLVIDHPSSPTYGTSASLRAAAEQLGGTASVDSTLRAANLTLQMPRIQAREPLDSVSMLPALAEVTEQFTPLFRRTRGRPSYQAVLSPPIPRELRIPDPAGLAADGSQPELTIPPEQSFAEGAISVTTQSRNISLLLSVDGTHTKPVSIEYIPASATYTFAISYLVHP